MSYKFKVNGNTYTHPNKEITGSEIKTYDNIPDSHFVYQKISGFDPDVKIMDNTVIDVTRNPVFFSTIINL